jgi:TIR domain
VYASFVDVDGAGAFWSYVHDDDDAEGGRIVELGRDLGSQYGLITGGKLELFLDVDVLKWGDEWREEIEQAINAATFFVPIITPRYFSSEECRRELILFAREMARLGVPALLLPILYVPVADLDVGEPTDEAMKLVKARHWENWTELRFDDRASPTYRRAVARLAEKMAGTVVDIETVVPTTVSPKPTLGSDHSLDPKQDDDDAPGFLELIAEGEEALPRWSAVVQDASPMMESLGKLAEDAAREMKASDARGGGAAGRLKVAARMAAKMREPVDQILRLGEQYTKEVEAVDGALGAILGVLEEHSPSDSDEIKQAEEFFDVVEEMSQSAAVTTEALKGLSSEWDSATKAARVLRPVARDLQRGLRAFVDAQAIYDDWTQRIREIRGESDRGAGST